MHTVDPAEMIDRSWKDIVAQLPPDLDGLAKAHDVLKYHRAFDAPESLLRVAFAYAIQDMSLRSVAAWAPSAGVCKEISDVALMKQLQSLPGLLTALIQRLLAPRADSSLLAPGLTLVDGTSLSRRGSKGTDWRINLAYSGASGQSVAVDLTDSSKGESFDSKRIRSGDVVVGDRHYCKGEMLASILQGKASFLIRAVRTFKVLTLEGECKRIQDFLPTAGTSPGQILEHTVQIKHGGRLTAARLILIRKTGEAAARAERKLQRLKSKKQLRNSDTPEALLAAQYMCLLTTVPNTQATAEAIANAYRYRWQVELCFKRWKSLLHFDNLRARGALAKTYVLTKLLAALLIEETLHQASFSPWGTSSVRTTPKKPAFE